jgi:hypothetical protein
MLRSEAMDPRPSTGLAKTALICSIASFACCFPLALAGLGMALTAIARARRAQQPVPTSAMVAVVLAVMSLVVSCGVGGMMFVSEKERRQRIGAVETRLTGKRDAATLEASTACALVEEQLLAGLFENDKTIGAVTCTGPLEPGADRAVLRGVEFKRMSDPIRLSACLARTHRWFVLRVTEDGECPATALAPKPAATDAEMKAQEDEYRRADAVQRDEQQVQTHAAAVQTLRARVLAAPSTVVACPEIDVKPYPASASDGRLKIPSVTVDLLDPTAVQDHSSDDPWTFLTASDMRTALNGRNAIETRANAIRRMRREAGPYLLVYHADSSAWPGVHPAEGLLGRPKYTDGSFDGWMVLTDVRAGAIVCTARLAFRSSDEITYRRRGPGSDESRLRSAVEKDFEEQFEKHAGETIKTMTAGKLRLGLSFFE